MASLIKILLIGRVGGDPEMRFTPDGVAVTSFSLAANRNVRQADGSFKEETEWFRISAWRKLAETCNQFLTKGKLVYVEGSLRTRTYDGKDGQKRFSLDVTAEKVIFLDKQGTAQLTPGETQDEGEGGISVDEIPF
jgi:single-strand DNA-binding protein